MPGGGVTLSGDAWRRTRDAVRWVEQRRGALDLPAPAETATECVFARVTDGTPDGDGLYGCVVCLYSAPDAAWTEYGAAKLLPANGERLKLDNHYPCRPAGDSAGGDPVLVVMSQPLRVKAADGSPDYADVREVRVDETGFLTLSSPAAGVALLECAGLEVREVDSGGATTDTHSGTVLEVRAASGPLVVDVVAGAAGPRLLLNVLDATVEGTPADGVMTTGAQILGGNKYFVGQLTLCGGLLFGETTSPPTVAGVTTGGYVSGTAAGVTLGVTGGASYSVNADGTGTFDDGEGHTHTLSNASYP